MPRRNNAAQRRSRAMVRNNQFFVEAVLDQRRNADGETEYLIRWEGYGPEDDLWRPTSALDTTGPVFVAWEQRNANEVARQAAADRGEVEPDGADEEVFEDRIVVGVSPNGIGPDGDLTNAWKTHYVLRVSTSAPDRWHVASVDLVAAIDQNLVQEFSEVSIYVAERMRVLGEQCDGTDNEFDEESLTCMNSYDYHVRAETLQTFVLRSDRHDLPSLRDVLLSMNILQPGQHTLHTAFRERVNARRNARSAAAGRRLDGAVSTAAEGSRARSSNEATTNDNRSENVHRSSWIEQGAAQRATMTTTSSAAIMANSEPVCNENHTEEMDIDDPYEFFNRLPRLPAETQDALAAHRTAMRPLLRPVVPYIPPMSSPVRPIRPDTSTHECSLDGYHYTEPSTENPVAQPWYGTWDATDYYVPRSKPSLDLSKVWARQPAQGEGEKPPQTIDPWYLQIRRGPDGNQLD